MNSLSPSICHHESKTVILSVVVSSNYIYILTADNQFQVIDKFNKRLIQSFQISLPPNGRVSDGTNKIYISPDGINCMILCNGVIFHYILDLSANSQSPKKISTPPDEEPLCGTWFEEDSILYFIFGTNKGNLFQLNPLNTISTTIIALENQETICDIFICQKQGPNDANPRKFCSLCVDNSRLFYYSSPNSLVEMFTQANPSNIQIGAMNSPIFSRLSYYNAEISILWDYGILTLKYFPNKSGTTQCSQELINLPPENLKHIQVLCSFKYGFLTSTNDTVTFYSNAENDQTFVSFPLSNVVNIQVDDNSVWFVTPHRIYTLPLDDLIEAINEVAVKRNDYNLLYQTAKDPELKKKAFLQKLDSFTNDNEIAEFLYNCDWPFQLIVTTLLNHPNKLISYFNLLLIKKCKFELQIAHWLLLLYTQQLPEKKSALLDYITKYYKLFSKKMVLQIFNKIDFWEGIETYLDLIDDRETLLLQCTLCQNYKKIEELFIDTLEPSIFVNNVFRLLHNYQRITPETLCEQRTNVLYERILDTKNFTPNSIIPILWNSPDLAFRYREGMTRMSAVYEILLALFYAKLKKQNEIVRIGEDRRISYAVIRICLSNGCNRAAARIIWKLRKPKIAIDFAISQEGETPESNVEFAKDLINSNIIHDDNKIQIERDAWIRLLQVTQGDIRRGVMSDVIEKDLFDFEEITDYIDEKDTILQYEASITSAIEKIHSVSKPTTYASKFRPIRFPDIPIKLSDCCDLCGSTILGKKFIIFPCKHMVHTECVKEQLEELKKMVEEFQVRLDDDYLKSCPVCGFHAVLQAIATS